MGRVRWIAVVSFIVGPARTGTTWIYETLRRSEQASVIKGKEIYFFDRNFDRGMAWYERQFSDNRGPRVDVSPTYFSSAAARERIATSYSGAKILVILRNQLDLIWSQYRYATQAGSTDRPFNLFIADNPKLVERFFYADALEQWFEIFGKERVGMMFFPEFERDKTAYFCKLGRFLDLDLGDISKVEGYVTSDKINASGKQLAYRSAYRRLVSAGRLAERVVGRQLAWSIKRNLVDPIFMRRVGVATPSPADIRFVRSIYANDVLELRRLVDEDLEFMSI